MPTIRAELLLAGDSAWTDITSQVRTASGLTIDRGRADEASQPGPASARLTLNNRGGNFSLRNPAGAYYPKLRRNTPIRLSVMDTVYLDQPTGAGYASAPDSAGLSVTGDLDIRADVWQLSWRTPGGIIGKYLETGNQRSYALYLTTAGKLRLYWSPDGTTGLNADSTAVVPLATGRLSVRATIDVDNGAAGRTITFYAGTGGVNGTWTQLGSTVVQVGTTSVFNSTSPAYLGNTSSLAAATSIGKVYAGQIRSGIGGTVVGNPDVRTATSGASSFTDSVGNTWTCTAPAEITSRATVFTGEIAEWPVEFDMSEREIAAPIQAAGITRRLGQGTDSLHSAMWRGVQAVSSMVAHWPLEDGSDARVASSAGPSSRAMTITRATPGFGADGFACADGAVTLNSATLQGTVGTYTGNATKDSHTQMLVSWPNAPENTGIIMRVYTRGNAARWDVSYQTGGNLVLSVWDSDGVAIDTTAPLAFGVDGQQGLLSLEMSQSGANVAWALKWIRVGTLIGLAISGSVASRTTGTIRSVALNPGGRLATTVASHCWVQSAITSAFDLSSQITAFQDEVAGARIQRLCAEEGVPFFGFGSMADSVAMGPQRPDTLLNLLREAADADLGILSEYRDQLGLAYRPGRTLASQLPALTIPFDSLSGMQPTEDDGGVRNDVTVSRPSGGSARATRATGYLAVAAIGRYADSLEVNVNVDSALDDQASMRAAIGTVDEPRFPAIAMDLANPRNASSLTAIMALDLGDQLVVSNPLDYVSYNDVQQLVQGYSQTISPRTHRIEYRGSPASPWNAGVYQDTSGSLRADSRYGSDGSFLAVGAYNTTTTGFYVSTPVRAVVDDVGELLPLDFIVAGERVTVTAVAAFSATVQVFTVVRSVNGVVKAQALGAEITLFRPAKWGL